MQRLLDAISKRRGAFVCTDEDLSEWLDDKEIAALKKASVLVTEQTAAPVACPACGGHMVTPVFSGMKDGKRNYHIKCDDPAIGTFDLTEDFNRYRVDLTKLAKVIASGLGLDGTVQETRKGQLYQLGTKTTTRGVVRCWLLLSDDIAQDKSFFEDSSKTATTVVLYGHTPPFSFINTVAVINIGEVVSVQRGQMKIDPATIDHAAGRLMGANYYEAATLYVRGDAIASFKRGTKLDIVLAFISDPSRIDKAVPYADILGNYNAAKGTKHAGAAQWCYQVLTDLRKAFGDKHSLVDALIQKGGKKGEENSLIFKSKA